MEHRRQVVSEEACRKMMLKTCRAFWAIAQSIKYLLYMWGTEFWFIIYSTHIKESKHGVHLLLHVLVEVNYKVRDRQFSDVYCTVLQGIGSVRDHILKTKIKSNQRRHLMPFFLLGNAHTQANMYKHENLHVYNIQIWILPFRHTRRRVFQCFSLS